MLLQPWVVGRALDREVDADLDPQLLRLGDELLELFERAELRVDRVVAAELGADRPGAARVERTRFERVVLALAVRASDRVDRREVDDVEAELRKLRQHRAHALEAAPGTWKELVPRAEARKHAVDVDLERLRPRLPRAVARLLREHLVGRDALDAEEHGALGELAAQVGLAGVDLAADLLLVGRDAVDPGLDAVEPAPGVVDDERPRPLVVAERLQGRLLPPGRARRLVPDRGPERLVAVPEDDRRHLDAVALDAFDRIAAAVDLRCDPLDLDARRGFARLGKWHVV